MRAPTQQEGRYPSPPSYKKHSYAQASSLAQKGKRIEMTVIISKKLILIIPQYKPLWRREPCAISAAISLGVASKTISPESFSRRVSRGDLTSGLLPLLLSLSHSNSKRPFLLCPFCIYLSAYAPACVDLFCIPFVAFVIAVSDHAGQHLLAPNIPSTTVDRHSSIASWLLLLYLRTVYCCCWIQPW
jgi:hypothetical protein